MDILYKINENIFNCSVKIENSVYSYNYLIDELRKRHKRKYNRAIKSPIIEKVNSEKFDKSSLTKDQLDELLIYLKTKEARKWKTKLRSLRRKGKLEQYKIDKLNEMGMLWNPTTDHWEKMYRDFSDDVLDTKIGYMLRKEYSSPSIVWINNYENWVNEQKSLFKKKIIPKENLLRLNYAGFQFSDEDYDNYKFSFLRLIKLIVFIMKLSSYVGKGGESGRTDFIEYFNLKDQENYIGSYIFISEYTYLSKVDYSEYRSSKFYGELSIEDKKYISIEDKKINKLIKQLKESLEQRNTHSFIDEIDIIFNKKYRYFSKFKELNNFLLNVYYDKKKHLEVKFKFNDEIKKYAAEKIIEILDNKLLDQNSLRPYGIEEKRLREGKSNTSKDFKSIYFLLRYHKKNRNYRELEKIKSTIKRHQILDTLFVEKFDETISNLKFSI